MKINIGPYKNWIGPYQLAEKILFWKNRYEDDSVYALGNFFAHGKYTRYDINDSDEHTWFYKLLSWIDSKRKRKIKIKIHKYDIWSMDHTLSLIILPMLKMLRENKYGSPSIDDEDVPLELRSINDVKDIGDDESWHYKWDYVLGEMIWAFEQKVDESSDNKFYTDESSEGDSLEESINKIKVDYDGLKAFEERRKNGFRLFGKYYQGLWT